MILTMFLPISINILRMLPCLFPGSFVYRFIACSTLGRMQEKFGQTMKKAMSHKMELHTKAHWLPTAAVDTLKIFEVCSCWSHADQRTFKAKPILESSFLLMHDDLQLKISRHAKSISITLQFGGRQLHG